MNPCFYPRLAGFALLVSLTGTLILQGLPLLAGTGAFTFFLALDVLFLAGFAWETIIVLSAWVRSEAVRSHFSGRVTADFLSVAAAAPLTFLLGNGLGIGPVTAVGLVGILGALLLPRRAGAIYCGAFAGMVCPSLLESYLLVTLAGIFSGLFFVLAGDALDGFGGKLGTIALGGTLAVIYLTGHQTYSAAPFSPDQSVFIVALSVLSAMVTFALNDTFKHGPVLASGVVGLTGGLILPSLLPSLGQTPATIVLCASFAGMSSRRVVARKTIILVAGFFCGMIFIYSLPYFGGAGGKLGGIALGSVLAARGLFDLSGLRRRPADTRTGCNRRATRR